MSAEMETTCSSCNSTMVPLVKEGVGTLCRNCGATLLPAAPAPVVYPQQKPFPWMVLIQVLVLVLLVVLLRKDLLGTPEPATPAMPVVPSQSSLTVKTESDSSEALRILVRQVEDLQTEILKLKNVTTKIIAEAEEENTTLRKELTAKLKIISDRQDKTYAVVSEYETKQAQLDTRIKDAEEKLSETTMYLDKLRVRVLAKEGISPKTSSNSKNRLMGYKPDTTSEPSKEVSKPEPTEVTPYVVKTTQGVVGLVGEPPVPNFAKKWGNEWDTTISKEEDPLKRRAFVYGMLSHPQRSQGTQVYLKALDDEDLVVRKFAVSALREFTGKNVGYNPSDSRNIRLKKIEEWKQVLSK